MPLQWAEFETYRDLQKGESTDEVISIKPREGALELSCCEGELVYSKLQSKLWPFIKTVADKVVQMLDNPPEKKPALLKVETKIVEESSNPQAEERKWGCQTPTSHHVKTMDWQDIQAVKHADLARSSSTVSS